jgi:two-component system response regulator AtoC
VNQSCVVENAGYSSPQDVLIVDDEASMRTALESSFLRRGWRVDTASGTTEAIAKFRQARHSLVVTDIRMPDGDGFSVLRQVHACDPRTAVILLTAYGSIPGAVTAMKDGACDYLVKPVAFEQLVHAAQQILARIRPHASDCSEIVGQSFSLRRALDRARQVAVTDADILIQAESGTGKELLAKMIHRLSRRRERPLVAVNCAAFPENLLESELFGHVKGAFTGAMIARPGKFELADGGTLLLDEVGEMPLPLQPKLLRALQEREVDRLGSSRPVKVDIRVIATTNRPLELMVREGAFRADLYYRLNVIPLTLPALRERPEDIAGLASHFTRLYSPGHTALRMKPDFLARIQEYRWPGNVRELANLMRRAVALSADEIGLDILEPGELGGAAQPAMVSGEPLRPGVSLEVAERRLLEMTLDATGGNRSRAAEMLGVSLRTVRNKIRDYGLPPKRSYAAEDVQPRELRP